MTDDRPVISLEEARKKRAKKTPADNKPVLTKKDILDTYKELVGEDYANGFSSAWERFKSESRSEHILYYGTLFVIVLFIVAFLISVLLTSSSRGI